MMTDYQAKYYNLGLYSAQHLNKPFYNRSWHPMALAYFWKGYWSLAMHKGLKVQVELATDEDLRTGWHKPMRIAGEVVETLTGNKINVRVHLKDINTGNQYHPDGIGYYAHFQTWTMSMRKDGRWTRAGVAMGKGCCLVPGVESPGLPDDPVANAATKVLSNFF